MSRRARVLAVSAALLLWACDPVNDDAVAALGGEASGVRPGPLHRPGQPCLLCHDGAFGNPPAFSLAGTVFLQPTGKQPVQSASVDVQEPSGTVTRFETNQAGNFYVSPSRFQPVFPLEVKLQYQGQTTTMHGLIGRDGACAGCHSDPAGADSPGHVFLLLDDGGVPP